MIEKYLTILSWITMVVSGFILFSIAYTWNELNFTNTGKLRKSLAAVQGKEIRVRDATWWIVAFVLSITWLIIHYTL